MERGILGGSFDPIHSGHVKLACDAAELLNLSEIWLVPARQQPLKDCLLASPKHRVAMCRLAALECSALRVCDIEMERCGPSFTVETVDALVRAHPGTRWTFLAGTDALLSFAHWREPERITQLCRIVTVERGGVSWGQLSSLLPEPLLRGVHFVRAEILPWSASEVRQRVSRRQLITGMVPPAVEQYILEHNLYEQVSR